ncbi:MAG TPA: thiolase domain-containing protein [Candidatus Dormibacteraeota bacterium]|jgi:acetyl-CoA acetyltransferase|nr:thiolase domain-containing protein [Candidatus Dormibacteraeota bacterium]
MRDVAVVAFAQSPSVRREQYRNEVEMLMPVVGEALQAAGMTMDDIGFTCSGSSDFLAGAPFSFVSALDAIGPWPPIQESHVEMDGAWALYEAWVRLQHGDIDAALVYGFGKSSVGPITELLALQLDPYVVGPLWPDSVSLAALQARLLLENGITETDMASVAVQSRRAAKGNPNAQLSGDFEVDALLAEPYFVAPLRKHDCPPVSDAAAAVVLAAGEKARQAARRPAWIAGIDHRIEAHSLGARDLAHSPSTVLAAEGAGAFDGPVEVAELHAPFSHQQLLLKEALRLDDAVDINPSGGALAANPVMAAGLVRIGEAAARVMDGGAQRVLAHATSGPCLQQNLVCVMEAR